MMCDALEERKRQKKLKSLREDREKQIDQEWNAVEKSAMETYDKNLEEKLKKDFEKKIDNAQMIDKQLREFKDKYVQQLQEDYMEGELLKRQVEEDIEDARRKEEERAAKNRIIQYQQIQANKELEEVKRQQREKEAKEEKEIEEFAKKKDRLDQLRKEKEADRMKKKQDERQRLIGRYWR
jgi:hypothetical protein